jgi:hypothetical protein
MLQISSKSLAQSKRTDAKEIRQEAKSFAAQMVICCNSSHDETISEYMRQAGAPTSCTRTQLEKTEFYKRAESMLAHYIEEGKRVRVALSSNYENAIVFSSKTEFRGLDGVKSKENKVSADENEIVSNFRYYTEKVIKVPVKITIQYTENGKIHSREVDKLDENDKKVYEQKTRKMWVCESSNRYTLAEVMAIFYECIGIDKAIAQAKAEEAAEKAEKAAQAAKVAADVAAKVASESHAKAEKADKRAEERASKAKEKKAEAREARKAANAAK